MASAGVDDWVDPTKMSGKQKAAAAASADDFGDPTKMRGTAPSGGEEQYGSATDVGSAISAGLTAGTPFGQRITALESTYLPTWLSGDKNAANTYEENYRRVGNQIAASWAAHPLITGGASVAPAVAASAIPGVGEGAAGAALYGGALGLGETEDLSDIGGDIKSAGLGAAGGALGAKAAEGLGAVLPKASSAGRDALLGAGERLGVSIPRAISSDNPLTQKAGELMKSSPIGAGPVEKGIEKMYEGLGGVTPGLAAGATKESAGAAIKSGLEDAIGPVSDAEANRLFSAPRNTIAAAGGQNTKTPLSNLKSVTDQINARRADILPDSKATSYVQKALDNPGGLTYQQIKDLRSNVGAMNHWGVLPEGMDGGEVSQVYGALSKDLEQSALNSGGQPALNEHLAANQGYQKIADDRKRLATLIGGRDAMRSPEGVYNAMKNIASDGASANIDLLRRVRTGVAPASWDELGRGVVGNLGQDGQGNWTPLRFLTDYGKLSDAGKDELFGASAGGSTMRQNLDDLQTVSARIKQLGQKYANTSKTGHTVGALAAIEAIPHAIAHPLLGIAGLIGAPMMGKFLGSPAGSGAAANLNRSYLRWLTNPSPQTRAAIGYASQRVAAAAGAQLGAKIDPGTLAAGILSMEHGEEGGGGGDQAMTTP